jgi:hypothetical protein
MMSIRIVRLFLLAFLPALLFSVAWKVSGERDEALIGNWRAAMPTGPDDNGEVWEFRFQKKGKVAVFRIIYGWSSDSQSWEPTTADQPAQGDNDEWSTENGFVTIAIRERYMTNRDLVCRYEIDGDQLHLQMAEIFRPVSDNNEGIYGSWRMETYDQSFPEEKRIREIRIEKPGLLTEKLGEKEFQGRIFPTEGGWQQLMNAKGDAEAAPDTLFQPVHLADGNLYLFQSAHWMTLQRRK